MTTASLTIARSSTAAVSNVGPVQPQCKEPVGDVILCDPLNIVACYSAYRQGELPITGEPRQLAQLGVGEGTLHTNTGICWGGLGCGHCGWGSSCVLVAGSWTVSPLPLASYMLSRVVCQGGAPGDVVVSVHQDAASICSPLVGEWEYAPCPTVSSPVSGAACCWTGGCLTWWCNLYLATVSWSTNPLSVIPPSEPTGLQPALRSTTTSPPPPLPLPRPVAAVLCCLAQLLALLSTCHLCWVVADRKVCPTIIHSSVPASTVTL